jgi:hypothetical protein
MTGFRGCAGVPPFCAGCGELILDPIALTKQRGRCHVRYFHYALKDCFPRDSVGLEFAAGRKLIGPVLSTEEWLEQEIYVDGSIMLIRKKVL